MKKLLIIIVLIFWLVGLCSCTKSSSDNFVNDYEQPNIGGEIGVNGEESSVDEGVVAIAGLEYTLELSDTPIYSEVQIIENNASTGEAQSYEELIQTLHESNRPFNFVRLEITYKYTAEEAYELTKNSLFLDTTSLFKAVITYDCLNNEAINREINLAQFGNENKQNQGRPLYAIGDEYCAYLLNGGNEGWWIAGQLCFAIHNVNDVNLAYQMSDEKYKLISSKIGNQSFVNLDLEMSDSEKSIITTTNNNPVEYAYKMTEYDLVEFIRSDWQARGYIS